MAATIRARRLLRDHFLRRFLDNDLISPNTDRHEVLVLFAASLAVPGLFITVVLLGSKYVIGIPTPALTSIAALDDKFLYYLGVDAGHGVDGGCPVGCAGA